MKLRLTAGLLTTFAALVTTTAHSSGLFAGERNQGHRGLGNA